MGEKYVASISFLQKYNIAQNKKPRCIHSGAYIEKIFLIDGTEVCTGLLLHTFVPVQL